MWTRAGGTDDGPLLVMLHGLGATGEVYAGLEALLPGSWPGGWLVVDLLGHGRSPRAASYTFEAHAAAVAEVLPRDRDVVLLGHSMGGMVALALAPRLPRVVGVVAFSTKTWWPPEHVEQMRALAQRPRRTFATRQEAAERHLRVAGLQDLVTPDDPSVDAGLAHDETGWRLAQDPRTHDFGTPDMASLMSQVTCPVTLARGSLDPFVREQNLRDLVSSPVELPGLGHNPHVEDPAAVLALALGRH